jgi:ribosomal protein S25
MVHQQAHKNLTESKGKSKDHYDKTAGQTKLQVGEKVLLFDETVRQGISRKLSAQWVGPYTITEINKVNATIARGRSSTKVHIK